jgi:hypothetical protein
VRLSTEATLMLLATALYLVDCFYLLCSNEALLVRRRSGWAALFGSRRWLIGGREPYLANVFTPHRVLYKLHWNLEAQGAAWATTSLTPKAGLGYLTPFAYLGLALLFVGLPLVLFGNMGTVFALAVVGAIYLNNLVALALVFRMRHAWGLGTGKYWSMAFECLVCPPFCIQLAKRITQVQPQGGDLVYACEKLLAPEALADAKAQCLHRLDDHIAAEPEESPTARRLQQSRLRFVTGQAI